LFTAPLAAGKICKKSGERDSSLEGMARKPDYNPRRSDCGTEMFPLRSSREKGAEMTIGCRGPEGRPIVLKRKECDGRAVAERQRQKNRPAIVLGKKNIAKGGRWGTHKLTKVKRVQLC